ncbi:hypothetical protein [Enterococcus sp. DIV1420a]|uniref:hypothetical protein n=1 Tax=Enterococcus sp. DIV1420a TaxID=2774672 RepID=UPI003F211F08
MRKKIILFLFIVVLFVSLFFVVKLVDKNKKEATLSSAVMETLKYKEKEKNFYSIIKLSKPIYIDSKLLESNLWVNDVGNVFTKFTDGVRSLDIYRNKNNKENIGEGAYQIDDEGKYNEELIINGVRVLNNYNVKWEKDYLLFVPSDNMPEKEKRSFKLYPVKIN